MSAIARPLLFVDSAMDIFSLAHRFALIDLLRDCARVLHECMTCSDVCRLLEAATYYDHAELVGKCWDLIKEERPGLSFTSCWFSAVLARARIEQRRMV